MTRKNPKTEAKRQAKELIDRAGLRYTREMAREAKGEGDTRLVRMWATDLETTIMFAGLIIKGKWEDAYVSLQEMDTAPREMIPQSLISRIERLVEGQPQQ